MAGTSRRSAVLITCVILTPVPSGDGRRCPGPFAAPVLQCRPGTFLRLLAVGPQIEEADDPVARRLVPQMCADPRTIGRPFGDPVGGASARRGLGRHARRERDCRYE